MFNHTTWRRNNNKIINVRNKPVKYSPKSASNLQARSYVFLACSSVMRLFISLKSHAHIYIALHTSHCILNYLKMNRKYLIYNANHTNITANEMSVNNAIYLWK